MQEQTLKKGDLVYIRPEYVDFVNPIIGEGDIVNYQPWEVTDVFDESLYNGIIDLNARVVPSCNIRQDKRTLRAVRQAYLLSVGERRQNRLVILLDSEG